MATLAYKPILYLVPAFDATEEFTFSFSYSYGSIQDNTILIKDNTTNADIYRNKVITRQLRQTIPANTLRNGRVYNVQIQVTDTNGDISQFSNPIVIYCYTTPTFKFANVEKEDIITSSFYKFNLSYSQNQGELLSQYTVMLYNSNRIEIMNTGNLYDVDNLSYTFYNLVNKELYYVRAIGTTVHNMVVDTGYIDFNVLYESSPVHTMLGLENLPSAGAIRISPNIRVINAISNPSPPNYINNQEVNLTSNGSYVKFNDGFSIADNFVIQGIGRNFKRNQNLLILDNNQYKIEIKYMIGKFEGQSGEKAYLALRAYNSITNYFQMSNYFNIPTSTQKVYFWIKRIDINYEIKAEILGG